MRSFTFEYVYQVVCAIILMAKDGSIKRLAKEWTLMGSLTASGLPAAIYALQNSLLQISYRNLDSLTFSMLNQTKIFFTALFTYIILRYLLQGVLYLSFIFFSTDQLVPIKARDQVDVCVYYSLLLTNMLVSF